MTVLLIQICMSQANLPLRRNVTLSIEPLGSDPGELVPSNSTNVTLSGPVPKLD